jgi:arsenate reductase
VRSDFTRDYRYPDLSIDQQLALRTAAANLGRQFDGRFGAETIERRLLDELEVPARG